MDLRRRLLKYFSVTGLMQDNSMSIYKALLKYGYSSFSFTILEICKPEDLIQREQHYIDALLSYALQSIIFVKQLDPL